jgi:hypothetical protein
MNIFIIVVVSTIIVYLLVGAIYTTIIYRQDTAETRKMRRRGVEPVARQRSSADGLFDSPEAELATMLVIAAVSWPIVMYNRTMDIRDRKNDAVHRHVLESDQS